MMNDKICGAKLRNKDAICQNKIIMRNGRCRLHGGNSLSGIAHPNWKHGRRSKNPLDVIFTALDNKWKREEEAIKNGVEKKLKKIREIEKSKGRKLSGKEVIKLIQN